MKQNLILTKFNIMKNKRRTNKKEKYVHIAWLSPLKGDYERCSYGL